MKKVLRVICGPSKAATKLNPLVALDPPVF